MNIIFPFVGDTVGGSHHSSQLLISKLLQSGVEVKVIIHRNGPLNNFFKNKGIKIDCKNERLPYWEAHKSIFIRFIRLIFVSFCLWQVLLKSRVDLVHVNDARMMISWAFACRLARIPLIVHQRTAFAPSRMSELSLKMATHVISISNFVERSLPRQLVFKSTVVMNPFNRDLNVVEAVSLRKQLNINESAKVLLFVGTVQPQKRPMVALEILNELVTAGEDVVLLIAGRYSSAAGDEILQFASEQHISEVVQLLGYRTDITSLFSISDIVLAPAVEEGFGRAIIEGMVSKVPVVAAASGGHQEIIKDNVTGFLCPPDSVSSFVDVILNIFRDESLRDKIVGAASLYASTGFEPEGHAAQILNIYTPQKEKIAFVIESMGGGGTQQVLKSISTHWLERGIQQILITFKDPSEDVVKLDPEVQRITIQEGPFSSNILTSITNNVSRIYNIRKAISKSHATTIISFLSTTNILVLIATLGLRKKVVVSERNDPYRQKVKKVWSVLRRIFYPLAYSVVCNSQIAVKFFSKWKRINNLLLIENSVRQLEVKGEVAFSKKFLLFVGRLHEQKRVDLLIRAFSRANLNGYDLMILGDGPLKNELKLLAIDLNVDENVKFLGHLKDPYPYYSKAHAFVMCSDYEGSPNALWEALSFGAPCIITDSVEEAVCHLTDNKNALIVKSQDVSSLTRALIDISKNTVLRNRLKKNGPKVVEKFSHDNVNKKWDELILGNIAK